MIKHFTTPEFADLLKQHGIEIETPFKSFLLKYEDDLTNIMFGMYSAAYGRYVATNGWTYNEDDVEQVKPAYLLSEVLTWLPEEILNGYYLYGEVTNGIQFWGYADDNHRGGLYWKIESKPIEQLITQGLTEGWLTKEIIKQQINPEQ